jgi:hypothetical protein
MSIGDRYASSCSQSSADGSGESYAVELVRNGPDTYPDFVVSANSFEAGTYVRARPAGQPVEVVIPHADEPQSLPDYELDGIAQFDGEEFIVASAAWGDRTTSTCTASVNGHALSFVDVSSSRAAALYPSDMDGILAAESSLVSAAVSRDYSRGVDGIFVAVFSGQYSIREPDGATLAGDGSGFLIREAPGVWNFGLKQRIQQGPTLWVLDLPLT